MDEQTFRRLSADAVAGRLDTATFTRWKAAAAEDPERAAFVVRVVEADTRASGHYEPIRDVRARGVQPAERVPRRTVRGLSIFFGVFGLFAGGLAMHSCVRNQDRAAGSNAPQLALINTPTNSPAANRQPEPAPPMNQPVQPEPEPEPEPEPQPEPEPEPQPEPEPAVQHTAGVTVASGRVRGRRSGGEWTDLKVGDELTGYERVAVLDGNFTYTAQDLTIRAAGRTEFGWEGATLRFYDGRAAVSADGVAFAAYKSRWVATGAGFVVQVQRFGGELQLLSGSIELGDSRSIRAPRQLALENESDRALSAAEIRVLETELIGPHRVLLRWDGESPTTTPDMGDVFTPGALGDGHAMRRAAGDPGVGMLPGPVLCAGEAGARLRMRVKTQAKRIRIEFRVQLEDGFRAVDALIDVPAGDSWVVVEAPLESLRAGRFRSEKGWLPGCDYSAFLVAPAVDLDLPLARYDLSVDDLLVYVPE